MWVVFKLVITVHDAPNLCVHVKNLLNALLFSLLCEWCATVVTKSDITCLWNEFVFCNK